MSVMKLNPLSRCAAAIIVLVVPFLLGAGRGSAHLIATPTAVPLPTRTPMRSPAPPQPMITAYQVTSRKFELPATGTPKSWPSHKYVGALKVNPVGWASDLRGAAEDDSSLYFAQKDKIWRFPATWDLSQSVTSPDPAKGILSVPSPFRGNYELGDLDYYSGILVVPLDPREESHLVPAVAFFRASDLKYLGFVSLRSQTQAPWAAVRPSDGRLYSSDASAQWLLAYTIDWDLVGRGDLDLRAVEVRNRPLLERFADFLVPLAGEDSLAISLSNVAGGAFDSRDHLYILNDLCNVVGGLMGFDLSSGIAQRGITSKNSNLSGAFSFEHSTSLTIGGTSTSCLSGAHGGISMRDVSTGAAVEGRLRVTYLGASTLEIRQYRLIP